MEGVQTRRTKKKSTVDEGDSGITHDEKRQVFSHSTGAYLSYEILSCSSQKNIMDLQVRK
jgi:hypothetical protein